MFFSTKDCTFSDPELNVQPVEPASDLQEGKIYAVIQSGLTLSLRSDGNSLSGGLFNRFNMELGLRFVSIESIIEPTFVMIDEMEEANTIHESYVKTAVEIQHPNRWLDIYYGG